jgi:hypothetical protein
MDTTLELYDLWLARREAARRYGERLRMLKKAKRAGLCSKIMSELKRQVNNYHMEWRLLHDEYKAYQ